ncbi:unnamed protein product [Camellia sinensis]
MASKMAHLPLIFMLCLLIIACSFKPVLGHSVVESLPGFEGPLPFELETGHVGVDESEDVQLFYYFVKSESNPKEDPLVLWLTGGPGCSAFSGFVYEIEVASIIFIDLPVGTGFSYGMTSLASQSTDLQSCDQAYEFLGKWLIDHPDFLSNPVYVGGESYTGLTILIIVQLISNGNEAGIKPLINLKGYVLGNPATTPNDSNYEIPFAHGMGLISDELYESLQRSCQGEYLNIDPNNTLCLQDYQAYSQCIDGVLKYHILEPSCGSASPKSQELFSERRYVDEKNIELVVRQSSPCDSSRRSMRTDFPIFGITMTEFEKRSISERGSITEWIRCNKLSYTITIWDSFQYHVNLSTKGYRSLIFRVVITTCGFHSWQLKHGLELSIIPLLMSGVHGGSKAKLPEEEDKQLPSKSLLNVIRCSKDGFLINFYDISIFILSK